MDQITRKGPGRPRKTLADVIFGEKAGGHAENDIRQRQTSEAGSGAQADDAAEIERRLEIINKKRREMQNRVNQLNMALANR